MKGKLRLIYQKLFQCFGPQHWWPADSAFEVMLGAILTQNTNWANVERAIGNLKAHKLLSPGGLRRLKVKKLASYIKPSGYYNIKAKRLKEFLRFFFAEYQADIRKMAATPLTDLRQRLLAVNGIGPETADSILLYALDKPIFVVDGYTKRILSRHGLIKEDATYAQVQDFFMRSLKKEVKLFNEFHALLVRLGKDYCLKRRPRCEKCPLKGKIPNPKSQIPN